MTLAYDTPTTLDTLSYRRDQLLRDCFAEHRHIPEGAFSYVLAFTNACYDFTVDQIAAELRLMNGTPRRPL